MFQITKSETFVALFKRADNILISEKVWGWKEDLETKAIQPLILEKDFGLINACEIENFVGVYPINEANIKLENSHKQDIPIGII